MRKWAVAGVTLALMLGALGLFYKLFDTDPHAVPFMMAGKPAPDFKLKRLDTGEVVSLDKYKGKPLVLNFWATWCGPCKLEHPVLSWGATELASQATFVGVVNEDTKENADEFIRQNPSTYVQLLDTEGLTGVDYGIAGVPETYFIDSRGIIREKYAMPIDPQTLVKKVRALQGPPPPLPGPAVR